VNLVAVSRSPPWLP